MGRGSGDIVAALQWESIDDFRSSLGDSWSVAWYNERRNGTVSLLENAREPNCPRILLKQLATDEYSPRQMVALAGALCADAAHALAARPIAFGNNPPWVAFEYVEGTTLFEGFDDLAAHADLDRTATLVGQLGEITARFHDASLDALSIDGEFAVENFSTLHRVMRWSGAVLPPPDSWIPSLLDPGAHNVVTEPSGGLRLIDLPGRIELRPREYDVGLLVQRTRRALEGSSRYLPRRTDRARWNALHRRVLEGYEAATRTDLDRRLMWTSAATSAVMQGRKRLRRPRPAPERAQARRDLVSVPGYVVAARRAAS